MTAPPLWVVERDGGRVYLLGATSTADRSWLTEDLRDAVGSCDELWLEVPDNEDLTGHPLFGELGLDPDETLEEQLGPARFERTASAARFAGVPLEQLQGLRPWLAAQIVDAQFQHVAGADPTARPEHVLSSLVRQAGGAVRSELTAETALRLFGELPLGAELGFLDMVLERVEAGPDLTTAAIAAWLAGDLSRAVTDERRVRALSRDLHTRLVVDRNQAWVPRVETMLDAGGSHIVLVGLVHLVGPTSVREALTEAALAPERLA